MNILTKRCMEYITLIILMSAYRVLLNYCLFIDHPLSSLIPTDLESKAFIDEEEKLRGRA